MHPVDLVSKSATEESLVKNDRAGLLDGVNIAIVTNTAWNIFNFRLLLAARLQQEGARVFAVAPNDETVDTIKKAGLTFVELKHLGRRSTNPFSDLKLLRELTSIYRTHKIDLALLFTPKPSIYGSLAGKRAKTLTVSTITGLGFAFIGNPILTKIVTQLYRSTLKHGQKTVFQNEDDLELFIKKKMISRDKVVIFRGSGVDVDSFAPSAELPSRPFKKILFVGRLLRDKGIVELLNAAKTHLAEFPQDQFHIVGSTDEGNPASLSQQDVDDWSTNTNLHFHGYRYDVKNYLADCDIVVLPSYREGMPRVVLEGMSMAKPCIVTDVPGCRDTVEHEKSGLIVPVRNAVALAAAIRNLTTRSDEELQKMGQAARQRAIDTFSSQKINSQYLEIIVDLLRSKPNSK